MVRQEDEENVLSSVNLLEDNTLGPKFIDISSHV